MLVNLSQFFIFKRMFIVQSIDWPVQSSDLSFTQQFTDRLRNSQIAPSKLYKAWINHQILNCPGCPMLGVPWKLHASKEVCKVWIKAHPAI